MNTRAPFLFCALLLSLLGTTSPAVGAQSRVAQATPTATPAPTSAASPSTPAAKAVAAVDPRDQEMSTRLQVPLELLIKGREGLEFVYSGRYGEAREGFRELEIQYPTSAIGPLGAVVLAQAQMAENLDFIQEVAYTRAQKETVKRASEAIDRGEAVAWNHFMRACALGVNGIFLFRKDRVVGALQDGWNALGDLEAASKLEPTWMDPVLGIGVYEYWSSALARKYKYVKFIEDKRVQGISKIIQSRDHGYLAPTFARLALVYTYWDYNKMDLALAASKELQQSYPNNIMNLEALGQLYHRKRQFDKAQATFQQVTAIDPRNYQVYFWMGNLEMRRGGNLEKARDHYKRFLADNTGNYYKAIGEIRLGDCYYHLGDLASAKAMWEKGYQSNPDYSVARLRHEGTLPRSRNARPTQRTSPSASTP